jgi:ABC-type Fe3+/spermidine/putrescine transport system ATPase subunit
MVVIDVKGISKRYGDTAAVRSCDLEVASGEILALLGPSGSGKTTLLRLIAGFDRPDEGRILIGGRVVVDVADSRWAAPEDRGVGMVFQDYALFPHLTVEENVRFGLRNSNRVERQARVEELLRLTELASCAKRYPHELSGGQQQRVALARALVHEPRLVVCDEPTSALDAETGHAVMELLASVAVRPDRAVIVVTHDSRVFGFADTIAHMNDGRIIRTEAGDETGQEPEVRTVGRLFAEEAYMGSA